MTINNMQAKLTRCRHGRPLIVLDSEPFNGVELRPLELIALAERLQVLAHMAVEHTAHPRYVGDKRVSMEITDGTKN
jgi:hypothetical protein